MLSVKRIVEGEIIKDKKDRLYIMTKEELSEKQFVEIARSLDIISDSPKKNPQ